VKHVQNAPYLEKKRKKRIFKLVGRLYQARRLRGKKTKPTRQKEDKYQSGVSKGEKKRGVEVPQTRPKFRGGGGLWSLHQYCKKGGGSDTKSVKTKRRKIGMACHKKSLEKKRELNGFC